MPRMEGKRRGRHQVHDRLLSFARLRAPFRLSRQGNLRAILSGWEYTARLPGARLQGPSGFLVSLRRSGGWTRWPGRSRAHWRGWGAPVRNGRFQPASIGVGRKRFVAVADEFRAPAWRLPVRPCSDIADSEAQRLHGLLWPDFLSIASRPQRNFASLVGCVPREGALWHGRIHDVAASRMGRDGVARHPEWSRSVGS